MPAKTSGKGAGAGGRLATRSPAFSGAIGGLGFGLALLVLGIYVGFRPHPLPLPLVLALSVAGLALVPLSWLTLARSRAAWAFAVSLSGTSALVFLFTAPKIRDAMSVPIGIALVPCVVGAVVVTLLAMGADDLR
jgi:hypothetical protein